MVHISPLQGWSMLMGGAFVLLVAFGLMYFGGLQGQSDHPIEVEDDPYAVALAAQSWSDIVGGDLPPMIVP
jgi:hypothetical protein